MQDRQVFEQILGIVSPWFVADVELALDQNGDWLDARRRSWCIWAWTRNRSKRVTNTRRS